MSLIYHNLLIQTSLFFFTVEDQFQQASLMSIAIIRFEIFNQKYYYQSQINQTRFVNGVEYR